MRIKTVVILIILVFVGCGKKINPLPFEICTDLLDRKNFVDVLARLDVPQIEEMPSELLKIRRQEFLGNQQDMEESEWPEELKEEFRDFIENEIAIEWLVRSDKEILRFNDILSTIRDCSKNHELPKDEFRIFLITFREALAKWYIVPGRLDDFSAAMLSGDKGTVSIIQKEEGKEEKIPASDRKSLSFNYLWTEEELRKLINDAERLKSTLERDGPIQAFIQVDCLAGALDHILTGNLIVGFSKRESEKRKILYLEWLKDSLLKEAGVWIHLQKGASTEKAFFSPRVEISSASKLLLSDRVGRVSSHVMRIAALWPTSDEQTLRLELALPYKNYLDKLRHSQSRANALKARLPVSGSNVVIEKGVDDMVLQLGQNSLDLRKYFKELYH